MPDGKSNIASMVMPLVLRKSPSMRSRAGCTSIQLASPGWTSCSTCLVVERAAIRGLVVLARLGLPSLRWNPAATCLNMFGFADGMPASSSPVLAGFWSAELAFLIRPASWLMLSKPSSAQVTVRRSTTWLRVQLR